MSSGADAAQDVGTHNMGPLSR